MMFKATIYCCLAAAVVLNSVPRTDATLDFLLDIFDSLFGDSSEETEDMIINTKPNATVMVVCTTSCNLNVMCVNCTKINGEIMKPPMTMPSMDDTMSTPRSTTTTVKTMTDKPPESVSEGSSKPANGEENEKPANSTNGEEPPTNSS
ncbi:uncharacterized protein LOC131432247 [Malaya genurostris]|uniref:uncharacterized protein LOC131432247 n=1 Tax=Malaya genurostris TaxID=325434 RepID=UPI0026F3C6EE|nr:uncharacterized protein LOC131432247 [Malaya genurostris]